MYKISELSSGWYVIYRQLEDDTIYSTLSESALCLFTSFLSLVISNLASEVLSFPNVDSSVNWSINKVKRADKMTSRVAINRYGICWWHFLIPCIPARLSLRGFSVFIPSPLPIHSSYPLSLSPFPFRRYMCFSSLTIYAVFSNWNQSINPIISSRREDFLIISGKTKTKTSSQRVRDGEKQDIKHLVQWPFFPLPLLLTISSTFPIFSISHHEYPISRPR